MEIQYQSSQGITISEEWINDTLGRATGYKIEFSIDFINTPVGNYTIGINKSSIKTYYDKELKLYTDNSQLITQSDLSQVVEVKRSTAKISNVTFFNKTISSNNLVQKFKVDFTENLQQNYFTQNNIYFSNGSVNLTIDTCDIDSAFNTQVLFNGKCTFVNTNEEISNVTIFIKDMEDSQNLPVQLMNLSNITFDYDTLSPSITKVDTNRNIINKDNLNMTYNITFSENLNKNIVPTFKVNDNLNILNTASNKTYSYITDDTLQVNITFTDLNNETEFNLTIENIEDLHGNKDTLTTSQKIIYDTLNSSITKADTDRNTININNLKIIYNITFSENLNKGIVPTFKVNDDLNILDSASTTTHNYITDDTLQVNITFQNLNNETEFNLTIENIEDLQGNKNTVTTSQKIKYDTLGLSIKNTLVSKNIINKNNLNMTYNITFSENLNKSIVPTFKVNDDLNILNSTSTKNYSYITDDTLQVNITFTDLNNETEFNLTIEGIEDLQGNKNNLTTSQKIVYDTFIKVKSFEKKYKVVNLENNLKQFLNITFHEEMNTTNPIKIEVLSDDKNINSSSINLSHNFVNETFLQVEINFSNIQNETTFNVSLINISDKSFNMGNLTLSENFIYDSIRPKITKVNFSKNIIHKSSLDQVINITFSENLTQNLSNFSLKFLDNLTFNITSKKFIKNDTIQLEITNYNNTDKEVENVTFEIYNLTDKKGNKFENNSFSNKEINEYFSLDFKKPELSISPLRYQVGNSQEFTFKLVDISDINYTITNSTTNETNLNLRLDGATKKLFHKSGKEFITQSINLGEGFYNFNITLEDIYSNKGNYLRGIEVYKQKASTRTLTSEDKTIEEEKSVESNEEKTRTYTHSLSERESAELFFRELFKLYN